MENNNFMNLLLGRYFDQWIKDENEGGKFLYNGSPSPDDIRSAIREFTNYATNKLETQINLEKDYMGEARYEAYCKEKHQKCHPIAGKSAKSIMKSINAELDNDNNTIIKYNH